MMAIVLFQSLTEHGVDASTTWKHPYRPVRHDHPERDRSSPHISCRCSRPGRWTAAANAGSGSAARLSTLRRRSARSSRRTRRASTSPIPWRASLALAGGARRPLPARAHRLLYATRPCLTFAPRRSTLALVGYTRVHLLLARGSAVREAPRGVA